MLLGGFWHGASWNFIIWGSLHGIALAFHKVWMLLTGKALSKLSNKPFYNFLAAIITFHFVCFCWIFFKAADFTAASAMLHQILYDFSPGVWSGFYGNYKPVLFILLLAYLLHCISDDTADKLISRFNKVPLGAYVGIFLLFVLLYGAFKSSEQVLPIYLKF